MVVQRTEVDSVVAEIFRKRRRQWRGQGGGGNPHETWKDLQGLVSLAFLLDRDAVFTVALWASANLNATLGKLQTAITSMSEAAGQLSGVLPSLPESPDLNKASSALASALITLDQGSVQTAAPKMEEARARVEAFVTNALVPVVVLNNSDRRTPSEARKELRDQWGNIDTLLTSALADMSVLNDLLADLAVVLPPAVVKQMVRHVKSDVDGILTRFLTQPATARLSQARTDLIRLLADATTLEQLGSFQPPVLIKTTQTCVGYGSGVGAPYTGLLSDPYELIEGLTDQLKLGFDAAAAVQHTVPARPNDVHIDFPIAPPTGGGGGGGWYTVPGPGPYTITFLVDGREGTPVPIPAGMWTVSAVVTAVALTPGAIPENPVLSPMLTVVEHFFPGASTVRVAYNVGGCIPSDAGIGCYVEIRGDAAVMAAFGWMNPDVGSTTTTTARAYWPPVNIREVIEHLLRQPYGGGRVGDSSHMYNATDIVTSGTKGAMDPADAQAFHIQNYKGSGIWYPATRRLTLIGDFRPYVRKGDRVVLAGSASTYVVTKKLVDGVSLELVTGTDDVAGSYSVYITPPSGSVLPGMTLQYMDRGLMVYGRILGAMYPAAGDVVLVLDRRMSLAPYKPASGTLYFVTRNALVIQSVNDGSTGITKVEAAASNDAAPYLGFGPASVASYVDQVYGASANFNEAGVVIDDFIYTGGTPSIGHDGGSIYVGGALFGVVKELVSDKAVRLDRDILGTTSTSMDFLHRQYQLYNTMLTVFPTLTASTTAAELHDLVLECLRAPETLDTASSLQASLATLAAAITTVQTAISAFRTDFGTPSDVINDCREALEESGADRAAKLLTTGRLADLFDATTDDATYSRRVLRSMRAVSRTSLGTSVFAPSIRQEAAALAPPEEMELGLDIFPQDEIGPPGVTKR